jgi:hypothetical protein
MSTPLDYEPRSQKPKDSIDWAYWIWLGIAIVLAADLLAAIIFW